MKVDCMKLISELEKIHKVSRLSDIPVELTFQENKVLAYTTNSDISILTSFQANGAENRKILVDGEAFFKMAKVLSGEVFLSVTEGKLTLSCEKTRFSLPILQTSIPKFNFQKKDSLYVPLKKILSLTTFFKSEFFILTFHDDKILFWTHDGIQLVVFLYQTKNTINKTFSIPFSSLSILSTFSEDPVAISCYDNHIVFSSDSHVAVRAIDQEVPDISQVTDFQPFGTMKVNRKRLIETLKRISKASEHPHYETQVVLEEDNLKFSTFYPWISFTEKLSVEETNQKVNLRFNSLCFLKALKTMHEDFVTISWKEKGIMKVTEQSDHSYYLMQIVPEA